MLIDSVIIVLREMIAAAFLVSVLLALAHFLRIPAPGLRSAAVFGAGGALAFDVVVRLVFDRFGGFGYELANVGVQLATWLAILAVLALFMRAPRPPRAALRRLMAAAMVLAIAREGGEILLYFGSLSDRGDSLSDALTGAVIGTGVGFSAGTLFYYLQLTQRPAAALTTGATLLALIGSGICAQATLLLVQADLLPAQTALWDSSGWLPESSPLGQLLYALVGYEATPSPLMAGVWLASSLLALVLALASRRLGTLSIPDAGGPLPGPRARS